MTLTGKKNVLGEHNRSGAGEKTGTVYSDRVRRQPRPCKLERTLVTEQTASFAERDAKLKRISEMRAGRNAV